MILWRVTLWWKTIWYVLIYCWWVRYDRQCLVWCSTVLNELIYNTAWHSCHETSCVHFPSSWLLVINWAVNTSHLSNSPFSERSEIHSRYATQHLFSCLRLCLRFRLCRQHCRHSSRSVHVPYCLLHLVPFFILNPHLSFFVCSHLSIYLSPSLSPTFPPLSLTIIHLSLSFHLPLFFVLLSTLSAVSVRHSSRLVHRQEGIRSRGDSAHRWVRWR